MKHVFGISSHLGFYLCQRLIEQDSLKADECLFFTLCGYTLPAVFTDKYPTLVTTYNTSPTQGRIFAGWRLKRTKENISKVDQLLSQKIGTEDFIWYTQNCSNDICSVFVTNKQCKGYYVIEDGSGSYLTENPPIFRGWRSLIYRYILKPFFPRIYSLKNHFVEIEHPKFKGCIASNENCFPLYKSYLRVVGMPFHPEPLKTPPDALISIDPLFRWGVSDEHAQQIILQLAEFVNAQKYRHIAYKHHPALLSPLQSERYKKYNLWIRQYIKGDIEELQAQVSLENTLMAHPLADFYTAVSTTVIYAHAMGVKCYSYCPLIRVYVAKEVPLIENLCILINPQKI